MPTVRRRVVKLSLPSQLALGVIAALMLFPTYFMVVNALKSGAEFAANPFALPTKPAWNNFALAWMGTRKALAQTVIIVGIAVVGIAVTTLMSGYAFARLRFREKEALFYAVFGLLLIPGFIVLIPLYVEIKNFGLLGSPVGLVLPYLAAGQALGIVVLRTFIEGIPEELFDAAKVDGAGHLWLFLSLVVPLSYPVLIALAVLNTVELWGDYILPNLVLQGGQPTISVAITNFTPPALTPVLNSFDVQLAAFTLSAVPIAIIVFLLMRFFISGLAQSAIKL